MIKIEQKDEKLQKIVLSISSANRKTHTIPKHRT